MRTLSAAVVFVCIATLAEAHPSVARWALEGFPPALLERQGWDKDTLAPGTRIAGTGWPARNRARRFSAREVAFPDGSKRFFGPALEMAEPGPCSRFEPSGGPGIRECTSFVLPRRPSK